MAALFWVVLSGATFFLLRQDRFLTAVERGLRGMASTNGMAFAVAGVRPVGLNGLVLENVVVRDRRHPRHPVIMAAQRIYLRLAPLALLRAPRHPEGAVA
ncbi:MAG: hypothetical protein GX493_09570, partial [Firmicutes bacterium]|nr:hypothetical protein [Bacillota bacterium]